MTDGIARGIGPRRFRIALAVLAALYYTTLFKALPDTRWTRPLAFFTNTSCLFPSSAVYRNEYRLAGWSCAEGKWLPLDVRVYFPLRAEDKESRFHRLAYFYKQNHTVMSALDAFISAHHAEHDDGIAGPIGGVRLFQTSTPIPPPGSPVERVTFEPLAPIPKTGIRDHYYTPGPQRRARCETAR